jgi:hypothetical protein
MGEQLETDGLDKTTKPKGHKPERLSLPDRVTGPANTGAKHETSNQKSYYKQSAVRVRHS